MKVKKLIKVVENWTGAIKVNVQTFCDEGVVYLNAEKKDVLEYLGGLDPKEAVPWIVQGFEGGALFLSVTQLSDHSVLPSDEDAGHYATQAQFDAAGAIHGDGDEIEIDGDARLSRGEDGYWVSAWVWVPGEVCRTCDKSLEHDGDGWDGECGNCADRAVNNG